MLMPPLMTLDILFLRFSPVACRASPVPIAPFHRTLQGAGPVLGRLQLPVVLAAGKGLRIDLLYRLEDFEGNRG